MSDGTQILHDQRSINETPKSFDSIESVNSIRNRPSTNTNNERQFVSQDPINPAPRFRPPVPPSDSNQFQLWRQPPPSSRPPHGYPTNRFVARNANEPRPFPPPRNPIPPLRTQEFQNRRSFEKPERPYDLELTSTENRLRPNSPWQRVRERLSLQSAQHQANDMESTQMKISAFEDAMNREMNKDRIPPQQTFRRDSVIGPDSRLRPQPEKRFPDEDELIRRNQQQQQQQQQQQNELRKQAEFAARRDASDPRIFDPNSQHRPSLTQLQLHEQNYINERGQQQQNLPPPTPPAKPRPLQAVPEYENRNFINRNEDDRLREDQNRNYRQDSYRDYRKFVDLENTNKENSRRFIRPDDFSQRSFDNGREHLSNRFDGEMNHEFRRGKNEIPFNRIDVNGVNDKNALTKDKHLTNDNKTMLDKKPTANGDIKPPSSLPELKKEKSALKTPTKKISPKSPEIGSANSLGEKKKVPMNKVQVGAAPSPNLKVVRSKIGSLENYTHKPGGGKVKIENRKLEWKVQPKIEAKNDKYAPSGGDKKITQVKLQWSAKSKIGSLENATHKPGGGDKKIESVKLDFKDKAKPKVGSKDNIKHVPGGGTVKKTTDIDAKSTSSNIEDQKVDIKAQSKVGSLDNVKHRPGGGDKKIFDDKEYLKQTALTNESSKANSVTTSGSQAPEDSQICSRDSPQKEKQTATADTITSKMLNKVGTDKVKLINDPKSPKKEEKLHTSTPKKSPIVENKPASLISNGTNKVTASIPEKITKRPSEKINEKVNQKPKSDLIPLPNKSDLKKISNIEKIPDEINLKQQPSTIQTRELVKIPSKENIKSETKPKPILEPVFKPEGKKLPNIKSASENENSNENKYKLNEKITKKESNSHKAETFAINKKHENLSDTQIINSSREIKSNIDAKPPAEVTALKKQNSKSKLEPINKKSEKNEKHIQDSNFKIEPPKSNLDFSQKEEKKQSNQVFNTKNEPIVKSHLDSDEKEEKKELSNKNSNSKIEPVVKSNLDFDKKEEKKESNIQNSNSKIEPVVKSNLDSAEREEKKESNNQNSNSKIEPAVKSNLDFDKKEEKNDSNYKNSNFKIEPVVKSNLHSDNKEEKKESSIKNSDSKTESTLQSKLDSTKKEEKKELNTQNSDNKVETAVKSNLDSIKKNEKKELNIQNSNSKIEPAVKLNNDSVKKEEKKESNIQDSKSTDLTAEEKKPRSFNKDGDAKDKDNLIENVDSNKSNSVTNSKEPEKASTNSNLKFNVDNTERESKNQSSFQSASFHTEKLNAENQIKTSDSLNSESEEEKSKSSKINNNQNNVVTQRVKPNYEKSLLSELKQTSETFSPILKSETDSKPSITTAGIISESKSTNSPILGETAALLRDEKKVPPKNDELVTSSNIVPKNQQVSTIPSMTPEIKK